MKSDVKRSSAPPATPKRLPASDRYEALEAIDWTFANAATQGETHALHPYPAKFIPQISRTLIERLHPGDQSKVLDPFCGSGTTLVEAGLAGVPSVGIDLHPLACLMSKVKVTPIPGGLVEAAARRAVARAIGVPAALPPIPRVDHWFSKDVQAALGGLVASIAEEDDADVRDALKIALSSIVVRVSNQESDTRYAAIPNTVDQEGVRRVFLKATASTDTAIANTWGGLLQSPNVQIINKDILDVDPEQVEGPVSLVITSPPYPNAYEYWLYHKYRMYWLGMDPIAVREREIGARPHYFKSKPQTAQDFADQMGKVFGLLSHVVIPGGHICFQVGNSIIKGELIDNAKIVAEAAHQHGLTEAKRLNRRIPGVRSAFNPQHGRIRDETILIFRR
jgi:hypothetical protein